jgi:hypothetical protein
MSALQWFDLECLLKATLVFIYVTATPRQVQRRSMNVKVKVTKRVP